MPRLAFGPLAMEHSAQLKANHALDLCRTALVYEGHKVARGREEMAKASLSTTSLPVARGNLNRHPDLPTPVACQSGIHLLYGECDKL